MDEIAVWLKLGLEELIDKPVPEIVNCEAELFFVAEVALTETLCAMAELKAAITTQKQKKDFIKWNEFGIHAD